MGQKWARNARSQSPLTLSFHLINYANSSALAIHNSSYPASSNSSSPPPPAQSISSVQETDGYDFKCSCSSGTNLTESAWNRHMLNTHLSGRRLIGSAFPIDDRGILDPERLEKSNWDCPHPTCPRKGHRGFILQKSLVMHCRDVHNHNMPE